MPFIRISFFYFLLLFIPLISIAETSNLLPPNEALSSTTQQKINPLKQLVTGFKGFTAQLFDDELLTADKAFQFFVNAKDGTTLHLNWVIAEGYYLYRNKIKLRLLNNNNVSLGRYQIPHGSPKHDEAFGDVEIFHQQLVFDVALLRKTMPSEAIVLEVYFQGCADRGVCYPPMTKQISLQLPPVTQLSHPPNKPVTVPPVSEQNQIAKALQQDTLWLTLLSFLGFGLLLSFTPCIFPMIPILSGIIVGQGKNMSTTKAFFLSLSYVIASALTYTVFGILAALFGSNLQVLFQQTWIIALFSGIFILLSLSMFGFYHLELPKSLQAKLHNSSDKHRDGSYLGAAIMGALSSLIVGPCVAAPLAGALIYIGQTGDAILGGSALFMMGLGMGFPLLIIGTSAGKLLPKAGHWLNSTKVIFGVVMLAMALWMLERILPANITMLLWAMLLIISAIYLQALEALPSECNGWYKLWKGLGIIILIYGVLLLIGMSAGNTNPLKPLQGLGVAKTKANHQGLKFEKVSSLAELNSRLEQARVNNQWVMLDFYADWCISCKEMEVYTFTDSKVKQSLANFILLQVDVTKNSADDKTLLTHFNLIGPPAILFFGTDKQERLANRVIGYQDSETFLSSIQVLGS
jgi:thiol:disulfide interchange protein DsbD